MNVLLLATLFPSREVPLAGAFVAEPLRYLDNRFDLQVISPRPWVPPLAPLPRRWGPLRRVPRVEQWGTVPVYHPRFLALPRRVNYSLWGEGYYRSCLPLVRGLHLSVIHAHQVYPDGYAGLRLKRMTGRPLVVTLHGELEVLMRSHPRIATRVKGVLEGADRIILVARYLESLMEELGVEVDERVWHIPNGYNPSLFHPMDRDECRTRLGLPPVKIAVYVGHLYPPKGLEYLLKAVSLLRRQREDFLVVLVGGGILERPLKEQAHRLGIEPWVRFVGPKARQEVPLWVNASDLVVLPSIKEAFPTVLPEVMACGRPVVASAVAGCPEMVSREEVGLLTPPADPEALAHNLAEGFRREWDTELIAEHALPYSFVKVARKLESLYEGLV